MKKWNELSMAERVPYLKMGVDSGIYDVSIIADSYNKFEEGGQKQTIPYKRDEQGNIVTDKYTGSPILDYTKASWYEPWMGGRGAFYHQHPEYINRDRERFRNVDKLKKQRSIASRIKQENRAEKIEREARFFQDSMDNIAQSQQNHIQDFQEGYKKAVRNEEQKRRDALYPYKLMGTSLATVAELGSSAYLLGKGAKTLGWLPNNRIINGIYQSDTGQAIASSLGTAADTYQLITANSTRDKIENSIELPADVAGIVGGTNWFRNTPLFRRYGTGIDNTLDFLGYTAAGHDAIFKPINWLWSTFNKNDE